MDIFSALTLVLVIASNHTYCHTTVGCDRYNCQDYTRDSVLLLRGNGYDAWVASGWYSHTRHVWVGVTLNGTDYHIEPQTGELVYPSRTYDMNKTLYEYSYRGIARGMW